MRIYITNFMYSPNVDIKLHLLIVNPASGFTLVAELKAYSDAIADTLF